MYILTLGKITIFPIVILWKANYDSSLIKVLYCISHFIYESCKLLGFIISRHLKDSGIWVYDCCKERPRFVIIPGIFGLVIRKIVNAIFYNQNATSYFLNVIVSISSLFHFYSIIQYLVG